MNKPMEKFEVTLPTDLWAKMGNLLPGPKSVISPLRDHGPQPLTGDQVQALHKLGIVDHSGSLLPRSRRSLEFLAKAKKFARLNILLGGRSIDKTFFYSPDALHAVSLTLSNQGLILTDPASVVEAITELEQFTGGSSFFNLSFNNEFTLPEALVLAAVIDWHRQALLQAYFADSPPDARFCDLTSLALAVNQSTVNLLWLVSALRHVANYREPLSEADIIAALAALAESGHVTLKDHACSLTGAISTLAGRYIVLDKAVLFETGGDLAGAGKIGLARCACLQAGVNDLLFMEIPDKVRLVTLSAAVLKAMIVQALSDLQFPAVSAPPEAVLEAAAVSLTSELTCPQCRAPVHSDGKFCDSCGASLTAPPPKAEPSGPSAAICSQCQAPLSPAAKFCPSCGAAVAAEPAAPAPAAPTACPHCGRPLKAGAKFCGGCGQKF